MENYLSEIFVNKKGQLSQFILALYDKSGDLYAEIEKEVFAEFRKTTITTVEQVASFLLDQMEEMAIKADNLFFEKEYQKAVREYIKTIIFSYIVDERGREPGYLFEFACALYYKLSKTFHVLREVDYEFLKKYEGMFDDVVDADYGAIMNASYFAWHFIGLSDKERVSRLIGRFNDVGFDCSGFVKMGLMMYIRVNLINHKYENVVKALDNCDYVLINDNMYLGRGVNRMSERFLVLFVNLLILNNKQDFVRKILEKNSLIRDCYEILLLNYRNRSNG